MEMKAFITVTVEVKTRANVSQVCDAIAKGIKAGLDISKCAVPEDVSVLTHTTKTIGL
jgi:hypothetical protein